MVRAQYLPHIIKGDMDSLRPDVADFYRRHGVPIEDLSGEALKGRRHLGVRYLGVDSAGAQRACTCDWELMGSSQVKWCSRVNLGC